MFKWDLIHVVQLYALMLVIQAFVHDQVARGYREAEQIET